MTVEQVIIDPVDQFPVGMRVLAVDDDPTCLRVLQSLLRRCQYQVTTTHQAISALKMLRENKDLFDLVISDVHMPDMDGFKLLELVGLEMDLPVIMLSGNGDPKLVMKGITHGACDYLLKPVRIEELKNIWQHVVRRKKKAPKNPNALEGKDKILDGQSESGGMGNSEQNSKNNKRRKDQEDDEGEERDEESDNDDPSSQKKPRVVWTVELHRKFVGAVNQLSVDKAVPKKILELMNVEKLTRENVASHLQKYRLYLKRISCVANQQANLAAALGSADPSYLQMGSLNIQNIQNLNGFNNFHTVAGSDQFQNPAFRPLPSSGMLGRLNSPAGMGIRSLPSPGGIQLGQQKIVNNGPNRFHQQIMVPPGNYNGNNILQGIPLSLEQQHDAAGKELPVVPIAVDNSTVFPISRSLQEAKLNTQLLGVANEPLMLDNRPHQAQGGAMYGNHSGGNEPLLLDNHTHKAQGGASGAMYGNHSVGNEPLMLDNRPHEAQGGAMYGNRSVGNEPLMLDNRPHAAQGGARGAMYGNQNSVTMASSMPDLGRCSENWSNAAVQPNAFDLSNCLPPPSDNISPVAFQTGNLSGFSPLESKTVVQGNGIGSSSYNNAWNGSYSSRNSALDGTIASFRQCLDQNTVNFPRSVTIGGAMGQQNYVDPNNLVNQQRMQGRFIPNNLGSLEDLASAMVKQEVRQPSGDFCGNPGPYGTCS